MKLKMQHDDFSAASDDTGLMCLDPSLAIQSARDETDINTIVKRFGLSGKLPENVVAPSYGDFTEVVDFQTAMNAIVDAERAFMLMPADVRRRFGNDPQLFVEFCSDDQNLEEMKKLGLVVTTDRRARAERTRLADLEALKAPVLKVDKRSDGKSPGD